jgi:hypothetical protein
VNIKKNYRTSHVYYENFTCILREYHEIHHKTLYIYHMNIKKTSHNITRITRKHHKKIIAHHIYTTTTGTLQKIIIEHHISRNIENKKLNMKK